MVIISHHACDGVLGFWFYVLSVISGLFVMCQKELLTENLACQHVVLSFLNKRAEGTEQVEDNRSNWIKKYLHSMKSRKT